MVTDERLPTKNSSTLRLKAQLPVDLISTSKCPIRNQNH